MSWTCCHGYFTMTESVYTYFLPFFFFNGISKDQDKKESEGEEEEEDSEEMQLMKTMMGFSKFSTTKVTNW